MRGCVCECEGLQHSIGHLLPPRRRSSRLGTSPSRIRFTWRCDNNMASVAGRGKSRSDRFPGSIFQENGEFFHESSMRGSLIFLLEVLSREICCVATGCEVRLVRPRSAKPRSKHLYFPARETLGPHSFQYLSTVPLVEVGEWGTITKDWPNVLTWSESRVFRKSASVRTRTSKIGKNMWA